MVTRSFLYIVALTLIGGCATGPEKFAYAWIPGVSGSTMFKKKGIVIQKGETIGILDSILPLTDNPDFNVKPSSLRSPDMTSVIVRRLETKGHQTDWIDLNWPPSIGNRLENEIGQNKLRSDQSIKAIEAVVSEQVNRNQSHKWYLLFATKPDRRMVINAFLFDSTTSTIKWGGIGYYGISGDSDFGVKYFYEQASYISLINFPKSRSRR